MMFFNQTPCRESDTIFLSCRYVASLFAVSVKSGKQVMLMMALSLPLTAQANDTGIDSALQIRVGAMYWVA